MKLRQREREQKVNEWRGRKKSIDENETPLDGDFLDSSDEKARLAALVPLITTENIYDGSATSREYARLVIKNFDEVLQILEELATSRHCSDDDKVMIETLTAVILSKRANAQRAMDPNR
jgi:hypothetical protein